MVAPAREIAEPERAGQLGLFVHHDEDLFECAPENGATRRDGLRQVVTSGEV